MRPIVTLLLVLIAVGVLGFSYLAVSLRGISSAVDSLPGTITSDEVRLSAGETPVGVAMQDCLTFSKDVRGIGHVVWKCFREEGESATDFATRCRREWKEICDALEGDDAAPEGG